MRFGMLLETIIWSKKVKKPSKGNVHPFILTKDKVFIGRPDEPGNLSLHADLASEFSNMIKYPILRGMLHYMSIELFDKNPDAYGFIDKIAALKKAGLVSEDASINFYDVHSNSWNRMPVKSFLGEEFGEIKSGSDTREKMVKSWRYQKPSPDMIKKAREKDPYAFRYGESNIK